MNIFVTEEQVQLLELGTKFAGQSYVSEPVLVHVADQGELLQTGKQFEQKLAKC